MRMDRSHTLFTTHMHESNVEDTNIRCSSPHIITLGGALQYHRAIKRQKYSTSWGVITWTHNGQPWRKCKYFCNSLQLAIGILRNHGTRKSKLNTIRAYPILTRQTSTRLSLQGYLPSRDLQRMKTTVWGKVHGCGCGVPWIGAEI